MTGAESPICPHVSGIALGCQPIGSRLVLEGWGALPGFLLDLMGCTSNLHRMLIAGGDTLAKQSFDPQECER